VDGQPGVDPKAANRVRASFEMTAVERESLLHPGEPEPPLSAGAGPCTNPLLTISTSSARSL
jgi:hypothetical protein